MSSLFVAETNDKSKKCSGSFRIDEFSNEIKSPEDIFFKLTLNEDTNENAIFRSKVSSIMRVPFFNILKRFREDLEKSQGPSVLVGDQAVQQRQCDAANKDVELTFKSWSSNEQSLPQSEAPFVTGSISQKEYFMTDPKTLFDILTLPSRISIWTSSPPITSDSSIALGQTYHLFDSSVTFRCTSLDVEQLFIEMDWRFTTWPKDHFSKVQIRLSEDVNGRRGTMLQMSQKNIPGSDIEAIKNNWNEYYWNAIKKYFGL